MLTCFVGAYSQNINTDRPSQSASSSIVPTGKVQVELGYISESSDSGLSNINTLIRWGFNEYFELRFQQDYLFLDNDEINENGLSPTQVGIKSVLAKEKKYLPEVALLGNLQLESGEGSFTTQDPAANFRLLYGKTISDKVSLGANFGTQWDDDSSGSTLLWTFICNYSISDNLSAFIEPYGFHRRETQADTRLNYGMTYLVNSSFQIDISSGIGLVDEAPDSFISFGGAMIF